MTGTRSWVLAGMLAFCAAVAAADVRVFVTSSAAGYGLDLLGPQGDGTGTDPYEEDLPIDPFRPTYSTVGIDGSSDYAYDYSYGYYRVAAYPPIDAPSGTVDNPILINAAAGDWAYIWFQFRNEYRGAKVNEIITVAAVDGQSQPTQDLNFTYYVQNDASGAGGKRWGGAATPPSYPEWRLNPQHLIVNADWGIQNSSDDPQMMFDSQAMDGAFRTGVALFGALKGVPSDAVYELRISGVGYSAPPYPTIGESTFFKIVPEPGTAPLWAALGATFLRRRYRRS